MKYAIPGLMLACTLTTVSAQTHVESKGQKGGVTAGQINSLKVSNFNTYVTASDLGPSVSTSLSARAVVKGQRKYTLKIFNPTSSDIDVVRVTHTIGRATIGEQKSYEMRNIAPHQSVGVPLGEDQIDQSGTIDSIISYRGRGKVSKTRLLKERFFVAPGELGETIIAQERAEPQAEIDRADTLFGTVEQRMRPAGTYIFTLPGDTTQVQPDGFDGADVSFAFSPEHQFLSFRFFYGNFLTCWVVPLLPKKNGIHQVEVSWNHDKQDAHLIVDNIEVSDQNSIMQVINGVPCDNKVKALGWQGIMDIWDPKP